MSITLTGVLGARQFFSFAGICCGGFIFLLVTSPGTLFRGVYGIEHRPSVRPSTNTCHFFSETTQQTRRNFTTTFITCDASKIVHAVLKIRVKEDFWGLGLPHKIDVSHNIDSLAHFADSVPRWLPHQFHYATRWVPRVIAPNFINSSGDIHFSRVDCQNLYLSWCCVVFMSFNHSYIFWET